MDQVGIDMAATSVIRLLGAAAILMSAGCGNSGTDPI
jgi:hypothetical protein